MIKTAKLGYQLKYYMYYLKMQQLLLQMKGIILVKTVKQVRIEQNMLTKMGFIKQMRTEKLKVKKGQIHQVVGDYLKMESK